MSTPDLLPCPFCGDDPWFEGDGNNWQDERRYVRMTIECGCRVSMRASVPWRVASEMTPQKIEAELKTQLTTNWNTRHVEDAEE